MLLAILSSGPLAIHDLVSLVPLRSEKGSHLLQYVVYLSYQELYNHIFPNYEGLNDLKFSPVLFTGFRLPTPPGRDRRIRLISGDNLSDASCEIEHGLMASWQGPL